MLQIPSCELELPLQNTSELFQLRTAASGIAWPVRVRCLKRWHHKVLKLSAKESLNGFSMI